MRHQLTPGEDGPEVGAADGQDQLVGLEQLIGTDQGHVGQLLIGKQVVGQPEKVGVIVPPLEQVLLGGPSVHDDEEELEDADQRAKPERRQLTETERRRSAIWQLDDRRLSACAHAPLVL